MYNVQLLNLTLVKIIYFCCLTFFINVSLLGVKVKGDRRKCTITFPWINTRISLKLNSEQISKTTRVCVTAKELKKKKRHWQRPLCVLFVCLTSAITTTTRDAFSRQTPVNGGYPIIHNTTYNNRGKKKDSSHNLMMEFEGEIISRCDVYLGCFVSKWKQ